MRLLLTSNGLCNESIIKVLKGWVKEKLVFAFIPTAVHVASGEKSWFIENLVECRRLGDVFLVDIAVLEKDMWLPRLLDANVIVVGGGNSHFLMEKILSSGFDEELVNLLKDKIYVGISAGSMVVSKFLYSSSEFLFNKDLSVAPRGLGIVDFCVRSHFNSLKKPKLKEDYLNAVIDKVECDMYAIDDDSAVVVDDGVVRVVSEGEWKFYSKS
jgi:dipeptidase E